MDGISLIGLTFEKVKELALGVPGSSCVVLLKPLAGQPAELILIRTAPDI